MTLHFYNLNPKASKFSIDDQRERSPFPATSLTLGEFETHSTISTISLITAYKLTIKHPRESKIYMLYRQTTIFARVLLISVQLICKITLLANTNFTYGHFALKPLTYK